MLKQIVIILMLLLAAQTLRAQADAQLTQYWMMPNYYNAASIGKGEKINIMAASRMQWVGMPNAPKTFLVSGDMPLSFLNKKHGLGAILSSETIGLYENISVAMQYAYKMELWGGVLSLGLNLGMYQQVFDGSGIIIPDGEDAHNPSEDGVPTSELQGYTLDLGAGLYYTYKGYYAGVSSTHLTESRITFDEKFESYLNRSYYFMAGGNITLKNPLYQLSPSLLIKSTLQSTQAEATVRLRYNSLFSGGLSYRLNDAVIVMLGAEIKDFIVGYAYEYPVTDIAKVSSGSHEVFVGYSLKLDFGKGNYNNKHKSIRIL